MRRREVCRNGCAPPASDNRECGNEKQNGYEGVDVTVYRRQAARHQYRGVLKALRVLRETAGGRVSGKQSASDPRIADQGEQCLRTMRVRSGPGRVTDRLVP